MQGQRQRILASYQEGVAAFEQIGRWVTEWEQPSPCGQWSLQDLAGHLLAIARYWTRLIDAAESGEHLLGLPRGRQLAAMNASDLLAMTESEGPRRLEMFLNAAEAYRTRLEHTEWDMTLGEWSGLGPLTVGQHSGVAIGEWHVHAWDMARPMGREHRPSDALIVAEGNRVVREVAVSGDPWLGVLCAYGRDPDWRTVQIGTD